ncbi:MaoC family dehydratase [Azospirillum sp. INR13]|uniref:MaoC family dehydratase n=1 Tax=Azospirillum sp. INR13 TaxID=2596919 RepID=UPI0018920444|nr:MaoC family dehydratase [Azospirillum sp. INR13]
MPVVFDTPRDLLGKEGTDLGASDWLSIDQDRIDAFARVTGDDQWIHVDPVRAKDGPFGTTIAHGYLTLSLVNLFLPQILTIRSFSSGVNVGLDRLRFVAPVPVGARIRGRGEIVKVEEVKGGAVQSTVRVTVEIDGHGKPACVADTVSRYFL